MTAPPRARCGRGHAPAPHAAPQPRGQGGPSPSRPAPAQPTPPRLPAPARRPPATTPRCTWCPAPSTRTPSAAATTSWCAQHPRPARPRSCAGQRHVGHTHAAASPLGAPAAAPARWAASTTPQPLWPHPYAGDVRCVRAAPRAARWQRDGAQAHPHQHPRCLCRGARSLGCAGLQAARACGRLGTHSSTCQGGPARAALAATHFLTLAATHAPLLHGLPLLLC